MTVIIPNNAVASSDDPDLLSQLQSLLQGINLLGTKTADDSNVISKVGQEGDPGAAVLESETTALGKIFAPIVAGLGGLTAIGGAIGSFVTNSHDSVRIAALGGAAGVLVAAILGFAYIASSDLKSRASGAVATYEARKEISLQFLQDVLAASQLPGAKADVSKVDGDSPPPTSPAPKSDDSSSGTSPASAAAVVALAASGAKAYILHKDDLKTGHLAGINCSDKISVKWIDEKGGDNWSDIGEIAVLSYTF
jgi:hypothetical protein